MSHNNISAKIYLGNMIITVSKTELALRNWRLGKDERFY